MLLSLRPPRPLSTEGHIHYARFVTHSDRSITEVCWLIPPCYFFFFFTLLPPALDCLLTLTRPPPLFTRIIILMKRNKKRLCCWHVTATVTLCKDVAIMADHRYSSRQKKKKKKGVYLLFRQKEKKRTPSFCDERKRPFGNVIRSDEDTPWPVPPVKKKKTVKKERENGKQ